MSPLTSTFNRGLAKATDWLHYAESQLSRHTIFIIQAISYARLLCIAGQEFDTEHGVTNTLVLRTFL